MRSNLTLNGLYQYDNTIFDGFLLAEDTLGISLENTVNVILQVCDGLEVLYPNPRQLAFQIDVWRSASEENWKRILDALRIEYSPIENYDRNEDWTDKSTRTDNLTQTTNGGTTGGGTVTGSNSTTNTHSAKGYNSGAMVAGEKEQIDTTTSNTTSDSTTNNSTTVNTGTQGQDGTRKGRIHGNIGVTTNQQMVEAELELRTRNTFDYIIADEFKQRFCLLVY